MPDSQTADDWAELERLLGRFPDDYVQPELTPATRQWIECIEAGVCPVCGGDCSAANPPVIECPMKERNPDA